MSPKLVRPQTFNPLQSPDSASPAVRFVSKQNTLFNLRPSGLCKSIALSAFPDLPSFLRHWFIPDFVTLGLLFRLRCGWVNDQKYHTTF